jgi:site-specific DNA-adenine methylase
MPYPGGKAQSGVYQKIINQIPPHERYFEIFAGGGAVLLTKRPAKMSNIAVDIDARAAASLAKKIEVAGLPGANVICGDAISFLKTTVFTPSDFVYADPPYLFETRAGGRRKIYTNEFGDVDEHRRLLIMLLNLSCRVMISGYWSSLYAEMLQSWRTVTFQVRTRGGRMADEWLWMNYPVPTELHDYRFLGENFRERERLTRIRRRWVARLERMQPKERYMLMAALEASSSSKHAINGEAEALQGLPR